MTNPIERDKLLYPAASPIGLRLSKAQYHIREDGSLELCSSSLGCAKKHLSSVSKLNIEAGKPKTDQEYSCWRAQQLLLKNSVPVLAEELNEILTNLKPYNVWHPDIINLKQEHPEIGYGSASADYHSARFQMVNFLAFNPRFFFSRTDLDQVQIVIASQLGLDQLSTDIIQSVNKADQQGLAWDKLIVKGGPYYGITSVRFTDKRLPNRIAPQDKKSIAKAEARERAYLRDLSVGSYEVGHKDPRVPLIEGNIVLQPSEINRSHKDRYLFDDHGLPRVPNPEKFAKSPASFYESKEDRRILYEALRVEFEAE